MFNYCKIWATTHTTSTEGTLEGRRNIMGAHYVDVEVHGMSKTSAGEKERAD